MDEFSADLIISRFNEDTSWTQKIKNFRIFLYNKGHFFDNSIPLPNVGRETQTYFYHIVKNYNNLSDFIFFTQANPFDHVKNYLEILNSYPKIEFFSDLNILDQAYFFSKGDLHSGILYSKSDGSPNHVSELNIDKLWSTLFDENPLDEYPFTAGAIFCVSRELILNRPITFYEKCLELSEETVLRPFEFERIFPSIFNPKFKSK